MSESTDASKCSCDDALVFDRALQITPERHRRQQATMSRHDMQAPRLQSRRARLMSDQQTTWEHLQVGDVIL